jgi:predicted metal-dependent HD superfamily phosphohydrolase
MSPTRKVLDHWNVLIHRLGVPPVAAERPLSRLVQAYSEPHRAYHNLEHIEHVLKTIHDFRQDGTDLNALELAAWFHDAVYDPRAGDNEERSADMARECMASMKLTAELAERVQALILMTKTHRAPPDDVDAFLLLDADLAILGSDAALYQRYAAAIRREYAWVPEEAYRPGRAEVLARFLQREWIYGLPLIRAALEATARANLAAEIGRLNSAVS